MKTIFILAKRGLSLRGALCMFAISCLWFISLLILASSCTARTSGVVYNPRPDGARTFDSCTTTNPIIVSITKPGRSNLHRGDKVAAQNQTGQRYCDGQNVSLNVMGGEFMTVNGATMQQVQIVN